MMKNKEKPRQSRIGSCLDSKGKMVMMSKGKIKLKEKKKEERKNNNDTLIENYKDLVHISKEAEEKYNILKNNLLILHQMKEQLECSISNKDKKLNIKKNMQLSKEEITDQLTRKLNELKEKTRMKKFEYDQLINETNKHQQILDKNVQLKNSIKEEMDLWLQKKKDFLNEITHERSEIYFNKKNRKEQLNKLLMIIKKEVNVNHNVNYLRMVQNTLNNEIDHFKNYKQEETKLAMDHLINLN